MNKVYCVGGCLDGLEVDMKGIEYMPISKEDRRDYFDLSAKELINTEEPRDKYFLHKIGELRDFYIWNDDPELKENLADRYLKNGV